MSTYKNRIDTQNMRVVSIADRTQPAHKQKAISLFSIMNKIWQFFLTAAAGGDELRIWQTSDNNGNAWWHGCDRATGRSICAATDDEMRAWIDRRYCQ
jgi:hypothetical protein